MCQDWEGPIPCSEELVLNWASRTRGRGPDSHEKQRELGSPLGRCRVSAAPSLLQASPTCPAGCTHPISTWSHLEPPSSGSPPQPAGSAQHFRYPERSEGRSVGRLGVGCGEGVGGTTTPALQTAPWLCFPRLQLLRLPGAHP